MVKISGQATLSVPFLVKLDMTSEEFEALSESKQNEILEESIDWMSTMRNAETEDIDVWGIHEE